jgi:hypothetical protein
MINTTAMLILLLIVKGFVIIATFVDYCYYYWRGYFFADKNRHAIVFKAPAQDGPHHLGHTHSQTMPNYYSFFITAASYSIPIDSENREQNLDTDPLHLPEDVKSLPANMLHFQFTCNPQNTSILSSMLHHSRRAQGNT